MTRTDSGYRLGAIVERFGGELVGDADVVVRQVAPLSSALSWHISFLSNPKYRRQLQNCGAGAVIMGVAERDATNLPRILSDNPYAYFAKVSALLNPRHAEAPGIHSTAIVDPTASIPASATIGAYAFVGGGVKIGEHAVIGSGCHLGEGVEIGDDSLFYPQVVVYQGCVIGKRAILHSGAVIGADGFGIAMEKGRWIKVPQIGRVVIGDDVEIGANTTVDRGALDDTIIEDGVKLDNQIQVAHNVHIGAHTAMAGCVGIAGSAKIGKYCMVGGGGMILGHLEIADRVNISAGTLVTKSIAKAGTYTSVMPFSAHQDWLKNAAHLRHLDKMAEKLSELEKKISELERKKP
ncbi:MAG: UDP-3-O-(3-hydroxymyristoyl)glucosamine N-acyltransferase [Sulfuricella sp.]|nr:UDP-3-O-(3-hydroxymyristoyl)glucosamine N-acyltransferase [Sulfuricella sp.]